MSVTVALESGRVEKAITDRLDDWARNRIPERLWAKDPTIWFAEPTEEIISRLGWLDLPDRIGSIAPDLRSFADGVEDDRITHAAVLGMGGSSLAPDVFQAVVGHRRIPLRVVDSTHPDAVAAASEALPAGKTLFVVSSKSGTTVETLSLFRYFWSREAESGTPGSRFAAVTDHGSPLASLANGRGFRSVFAAPPDVGGRYSALSEFGLVPATVAGFDPTRLQGPALEAVSACGPDVPARTNPAFLLGSFLGESASARADKATLVASPSIRPLVPWIEQLVAESTGKSGTGIVPIVGDRAVQRVGPDRAFVVLTLEGEEFPAVPPDRPIVRVDIDEIGDIAGLMFVFEMAIALAGQILRIHPFTQPDVQAAKDHAAAAMEAIGSIASPDTVHVHDQRLATKLGDWLRGAAPPAYAAIHAYLPPTAATRAAIDALKRTIEIGRGVAATADFGPRFLHSTGQLHKGGPPTGLFVQIVDTPSRDIAVPETDFTFGRLIAAQADGDHRALTERGRPVLRIDLDGTGGEGLATLLAALEAAVSPT